MYIPNIMLPGQGTTCSERPLASGEPTSFASDLGLGGGFCPGFLHLFQMMSHH